MENCVFEDILGNEILLPYTDSTKRILDEYMPPVGNSVKFSTELADFLKFLFQGYENKKFTVLDIGANGGMFSLFCSPVSSAVYAIEPSSVLCSNIRFFTKGLDNIKICNSAISSKEGMINFFFFPDCTGQSTIHNRAKAKKAEAISLTVPSYTVKSFLDKYKIDHLDICKMDIEGEEVNIFTDEVIEELKPLVDRYWIETHHTAHINGKHMDQNFDEISQRFINHGYKIHVDNDHFGFIAY
jgi:FkbM family methyltransferase